MVNLADNPIIPLVVVAGGGQVHTKGNPNLTTPKTLINCLQTESLIFALLSCSVVHATYLFI